MDDLEQDIADNLGAGGSSSSMDIHPLIGIQLRDAKIIFDKIQEFFLDIEADKMGNWKPSPLHPIDPKLVDKVIRILDEEVDNETYRRMLLGKALPREEPDRIEAPADLYRAPADAKLALVQYIVCCFENGMFPIDKEWDK